LSGDVWVFGYASLLWSTGFEHEDLANARMFGYHRALCVYSHVYRGSPERPGLVAGLLPGGSCRGLAFRVAAERWDEVRAYLHEREMIYQVYIPTWVTIRLGDDRTATTAYTFIANPHHAQYAGALDIEQVARVISDAAGTSGTGLDYVANTVERLSALGIRDRHFERVLALARTLKQ
jgi:cation transport protein ChaC